MLKETRLTQNYSATVAVVLLALCPNIVVTTAFDLLQQPIAQSLHASKQTLLVGNGLSNAGYAFGAIVGGFLTQRYLQRRLYAGCEAAFVVGSVLCAVAGDGVTFSAGRIVQGIATGLLLVIAVPPLATGFPARKLPITAAVVNVGFFGATTAGPLVAGGVAATDTWRWFFWSLAAAGLIGLALAALTLPHRDPPDPERTATPWLFVLSALGTGLPFFGVSMLTTVSWASPVFYVPLAAGLAALVTLIVNQYHRGDAALIPVRALSTSLPLSGTLVAMVAGASFVTFVATTELFLAKAAGWSPLATGLALWPQVLAVAVAAALFAALFRTRHLPAFVLVGLLSLLAAGGLLLTLHVGTPDAVLLAAAAALGFGAGATVSPGLWVAALAVPSALVGRAFALVELVRSVADFVITPVLRHVAVQGGTKPDQLVHGIRLANWIMLGILAAGTLVIVGVFLSSGSRPQEPDIEGYIDEGAPALHSPHPLAAVRPSG